ncbi:MAG: hypothetical protein KAI24_02295, partial [Planctomycetes bacterium]|nr:hypothetical protein [Planctomycetota bacterium]
MDDISRELPPDDTGAAPVSARQKGPEELVRFERGHVGDADGADDALAPPDRLAGIGAQFLADRLAAGPEGVGAEVSDDEASRERAMSQPEEPRDDAEQRPDGPSPGDDVASPEPEAAAGDDAPDAERGGEPANADGDEPEGAAAPAPADEQGDDEQVANEQVEDEDAVDADEAAAAVAAEAGTAEMEQDLDELGDTELGEDGLPIVPELEDATQLARTLFVLMLSSRDGMTVFRL